MSKALERRLTADLMIASDQAIRVLDAQMSENGLLNLTGGQKLLIAEMMMSLMLGASQVGMGWAGNKSIARMMKSFTSEKLRRVYGQLRREAEEMLSP